MKIRLSKTLLILLTSVAAIAQQSSAPLSFEVASIKPAAPQQLGRIRIGMNADGGMLRYTNVSLRDVIRAAYKVKDYQIEGPDWLGSDRFDIQAKFPEGATEDQVPQMLQSLLADRFKLSLHRESKDHPVYALIVGKNGAKLKPAEAEGSMMMGGPDGPKAPQGAQTRQMADDSAVAKEPPPGAARTQAGPANGGPGGPPRGGMMMMRIDPSGMHLRAPSATLAGIADAISRFTERPVVDMTGIQGQYSFDLVFAPETMRGVQRMGGGPMLHTEGDHPAGADTAAEPQAGSIFDAVQVYGLKLEPRKAPLEILTIDHIEKTPTEN